MNKPNQSTTTQTPELEPWSKELPPHCGWYFMRNEGETPLAEGVVVWVGHNRSGVRHEGRFFYSDHPFLQRREFLGPVTIESVNAYSAPSDTEELTRLREALQKILDYDDECACEHNNENCCERNNVFCPRCIAAVALKPKGELTTEEGS